MACDNPTANRLTIQILAAVAEHEAQAISERIKAALAAYKRGGGLLGAALPQCRNLTRKARLELLIDHELLAASVEFLTHISADGRGQARLCLPAPEAW
jgi:DNA invertase Pin-like site-specific DNA recombinase